MANNYFCPLYKAASDAQPWRQVDTANLGLLFDKFGHHWTWSGGKELLQFDPPDKSKNGKSWLQQFAANAEKRQSGDAIQLYAARQRRMVRSLGGQIVLLKNESRFVTGMGRQHPLENGFSWHHSLGAPYLAGTAVKGILRSWMREIGNDEKQTQSWFGEPGHVGQVVFFDLIPMHPIKLAVDVMTPHYGDYYQQRKIPGDWLSPNPITFLTVDTAQTWQLAVAARPAGKRSRNAPDLEAVVEHLLDAFEYLGAGAKTNIGMGRFTRDDDAEQDMAHAEVKSQREQEEVARRAREQAQFEASLANDSEPLRKLKKLQREQNWQLSPGDNNMMAALKQFADDNPDPPEDSVEWVRQLLESIPNYEGVWDEPDAMKGKKKNKHKYSASAIRELVKQLNPNWRS